jgi:hypothetical protein
MSLSVDNLISVQPTTTSSTNLQCQQIDVYNGTTNFHRITSSASAPLQTINIPNASGTMTLNTATQVLTNKMNHAQVGSATDPSYSWVGDLDTGMYRDGTNTIGFTTAGVARLGISDVDIVSLLPIECDNFRAINFGTAGNVVYGNSSSTAGMYFDVNRINFSTNSVQRLAIQDASITCNQNLIIPSGTSTNCGLQFSGFANTGLHFTGSLLYLTYGGTNMIRCQSAQLYSDVVHNFTTGTAAAPGLRGSSYSTTGLYWGSGPTLNVAVSGTQAVGFETGGLKLYGSTAGNNALYSPSLLQYYEDRTESMQFSFSPGGQTTAAGNVRFIKIGNKVTMQIPSYATITNNSGGGRAYASTTTIPLRFQPSSLVMLGIVGIVNGANSNTLSCYISSGTIYIERLTAQFSNGDTFYCYSFSMTWII